MLCKEELLDIVNCEKIFCIDCSNVHRCNGGSISKFAAETALELLEQVESMKILTEENERLKIENRRLLDGLELAQFRTEEFKLALISMYIAYLNKDTDCPHEFEKSAVAEYNKLICR